MHDGLGDCSAYAEVNARQGEFAHDAMTSLTLEVDIAEPTVNGIGIEVIAIASEKGMCS